MKLITQNIDDYLASNKYINWKEPEIIAKALELTDYCNDEIENIRNIYLFVRDEIKHSWDVQDSRITIKATEVLKEKVGICWAKANLFAALLRAINIPVGICYQRLTFGNTPDTGYCIHALNAVYVKSLSKLIRIDARGNKEGIYEEFSLYKDILEFPIRVEYEEFDYEEIYPEPVDITMEILEKNKDALYVYTNCLPERL